MSNDAVRHPALFWPRFGACGIGLLLVLVFLLAWYRFANHDLSFSSDHLYCLHFCDDAIHGHDLRGWHLPAAPYLFPDMVLLSALAVLTSDVAAVLLLYDAVHYLLLIAVLMILFRQIGMGRRQAFSTAALGLTLLLAVCFHPTYVVRNLLLLHPGNHMGCQLIGLAATAFVLRALKRGYHGLSAALLILVGGLCGFSDHLLIVQFLVPICAAALLLTLCRLVPLRRTLLTMFLLGFAAVLSMSKQTVLTRLGLVPMRLTPSFQAPGIDALKNFAATFWAAFHEQTLLFIALALHLAGAGTAIALWALRRRKTSGAESRPATTPDAQLDGTAVLFVALVLLLAPLCNAAALLVTNMVNYSTLDRYLYTWLLLPFLCLALWPRLLPWRPLARLVPATVIALVLVRLLTFPDALDANHFGSRYPPLAQALDDMVRKHGRLRGLGDYWRAREMHYLTHEHVDVFPIVPWGMPWFHGYNPNAFLFDDCRDLSLPDYHFVIVPTGEDTGPDAEQMRLRFGEPAEIIAVEGHEIWRYDRLFCRQLELFLRAQMAQRLVEQKSFAAPSEPRNLARPKRNLTPWDAPGNVQLPREQTLTIRFDQPVTGEMIDVAADFADEYMLWFFRAGRKLGKAHVGGVEWNGAEPAYCQPGLQSRLIAVPAACRPDGFDEVRLTPLGRSKHFALGHFLVFDEWIPYRSGWRRGPIENYHRYEGEKMARLDSSEVKAVADASASAGQARQASADFQNCMAYGPYVPLPPGRYRVDFAVKVEDNTSSNSVAAIDVYAFGGQQCLQSRFLAGRDFPAANQYHVFSLTFDAEEELDRVEYRVLVGGKTKVTLDYVDVTRLTAEKTSEVCEP